MANRPETSKQTHGCGVCNTWPASGPDSGPERPWHIPRGSSAHPRSGSPDWSASQSHRLTVIGLSRFRPCLPVRQGVRSEPPEPRGPDKPPRRGHGAAGSRLLRGRLRKKNRNDALASSTGPANELRAWEANPPQSDLPSLRQTDKKAPAHDAIHVDLIMAVSLTIVFTALLAGRRAGRCQAR